MIEYNEYEMGRKEKFIFTFMLTTLVLIWGVVFYDICLFVIITPLIWRRCKHVYEIQKIKQRKNKLLIQFKDLLYSVSASFATGRHLLEALEEARVNLGEMYSADSDILREISDMIAALREAGAREDMVVEDFARRSHLRDIWDFSEVYSVCRQTGGNMVEAIERATRIICEKISIESEIRVMAVQKKFEGKIITAMPFVVLAFLRVTSPDYLDVMYSTAGGRVIMTFAVIAIIVAYVMIERITTIEI